MEINKLVAAQSEKPLSPVKALLRIAVSNYWHELLCHTAWEVVALAYNHCF